MQIREEKTNGNTWYQIEDGHRITCYMTEDGMIDIQEYMQRKQRMADVVANYGLRIKDAERLCDLWEKKIRQQENTYELLDLAYDELMQEMGEEK